MVTIRVHDDSASWPARWLGAGDFGRMAGVKTLLNAAPSALREALVTGFLGLLQRPAAATE